MSLLYALGLRAALAAPIADDHLADIVATQRLHGSVESVLLSVADLKVQEELLAGCTKRWEHGQLHQGPGASASLVYKVGPWHRKLIATISELNPERRVVVDHAGKKGFITVWTALAEADGTQVEVRTLLNLPPRPFRRIFVNKVQQGWQACYAEALVKLDHRTR